ncbi:MAG: aminotransferase class V-fold PLP-dependent enzyme [Candidatus Heimdallarchaeota archaeon]|nr:MAG: aminotransferase class V-fold PLP-dependent enzyme [Candidatus Heimdallarchaeota archaeon]
MKVEEVLSDFPTINQVNYLSTASIGLVPNPVIERTKDFFIDMARGGTLALDEETEVRVYDDLRNEGSKLFGCNPEDVAVFNSVSEALNSIAWSLELKKGKIISTNIEFPSVTYPWLRLAEKENIHVKLITADNWLISDDELLEEIDESTNVLFLSHVEFISGQQFDLKKITKQAHEYGVLVVIDGIQAAGYIPLNMKELNVDVYITGSYKWLLAPFGTAIAYLSKNLCNTMTPAFVGWRTSENMWDFNPMELKYATTARKFEYSTSAYGVKIGLTESINYLQKIGIKNIQTHNLNLIDILKQELASIERIEIISPEKCGSIVTFTIEGKESKKIGKKLCSLRRPVELTIRQNMLRVSPHIYNTDEDILEFVTSLKQMI